MNTKTVTECAELFGVTRQAMNKRVRSLDPKFVEKNERNVTVVNLAGLHELERLYGKVVTAEQEVIDEKETPVANSTELAPKADENSVFELVTNLMQDKNKEIEQLHQQLSIKDEQLAEKDRQIERQQEMMNQTLGDQQQFFKDLQEEIKNSGNRGFFARLFGR